MSGLVARTGALVMAASLLVAPDIAAAAADPSVTLSPAVGPPTTHVQVNGTGFGSKEQVEISFSGKLVATDQSNKKGSLSVSFDAPKSAKPGKHTVKAVGESTGGTAMATFLVRTNWVQFRSDSSHSGANRYENVLSPKKAKKLKVRWTQILGEKSPVVAGGVVYIGAGEWMSALDAHTGGLWWRSKATGTVIDAAAIAKGFVYASTTVGIDAIESSTGKRIWHFQALSPPPVTVADGVVYFGSDQGGVYALDARTGVKRWFAPTGPVLSSPAVADGLVYFGSQDQHIYAVDAATGAERWAFPTGGPVRSSPSVVKGVVFAGAEDGHIYAIDGSSGSQVWSFATHSTYNDSSPSVSKGIVYVGAGGNVYALRASDGTQVWVDPMGNVNVTSSPAVANGVVYIGAAPDGDGVLAALRATTGVMLWSYVLSDTGTVGASPAVVDGVVYIGSPDGHAYAFGL
jgi:outer membrane protein assembly factor BamB